MLLCIIKYTFKCHSVLFLLLHPMGVKIQNTITKSQTFIYEKPPFSLQRLCLAIYDIKQLLQWESIFFVFKDFMDMPLSLVSIGCTYDRDSTMWSQMTVLLLLQQTFVTIQWNTVIRDHTHLHAVVHDHIMKIYLLCFKYKSSFATNWYRICGTCDVSMCSTAHMGYMFSALTQCYVVVPCKVHQTVKQWYISL